MADGQENNDSGRSDVQRKRSRRVSLLTEEQIQHKRDIDRKAQRALRQRTKSSISALEQRFSELQASSARREAELTEELKALGEKNRQLRHCLDRIVRLASDRCVPGDSGDDVESSFSEMVDSEDDEPGCVPANNEQVSDRPVEMEDLQHTEGSQLSQSERSTADVAVEQIHDPQQVASSRLSRHSVPNEHEISHKVPEGENVFDLHMHISPAADSHGQPHTHARASNASHHLPLPLPLPDDAYVPSLSTVPPVSNLPAVAATQSNHHDSPEQIVNLGMNDCSNTGIPSTHHYSHHHIPDTILETDPNMMPPTPRSHSTSISTINRMPTSVASVPLQHMSPTCPLDQILLDFLRSRTAMAERGVHIEALIGPERPSMKGIVNPELSGTMHPVIRVMSDVLCTFPNVELPEKMAFLYIMFLTLRWQIALSKKTYEDMPTWLRPTVMQVAVPHAAWIDNIPWPQVRDALIEDPQKYTFETFSEYYSQNVTVNWQFDSADALSNVDDDMFLHSIFEKQIRDLRNWTVSRAFQDRFPELTSFIYSFYGQVR